MENAAPLLVVARNLHKCYAGFSPVLRGVDIEARAGEMVAIMGPSGCGKSTMLHILGLLHAPDEGSLEILGTDVLALDRTATAAFRRENIGFVMQSSNLFEHSTVFENVEFPLIYSRVPPMERWERVIRALELVRLSARVHYPGNRLSGGEQQRVAIARAMVNNPRLLMADEPTGALDSRTSAVVMENFRSLCHQGSVTVVIVTHDQKMADYCDSVYTLEDGLLHLRKQEPVMVPLESRPLLATEEPLLRGALVTDVFPGPARYGLMTDAAALHRERLLARIFTLAGNSLLGPPQDYALPLAIRGTGIVAMAKGMFRALRELRKDSPLRALWREVPSGRLGLLHAFGAGMALADAAGADRIAFLYGGFGLRSATAAWVAARLLGARFGFCLRSRDMKSPGSRLEPMVRDAGFVRCATQAVRERLVQALPGMDVSRAAVLEDEVAFTLPDEEIAADAAAEKDRCRVLCVGPGNWSPGLAACRDFLRRGREATLTAVESAFSHPVLRAKVQLWKLGNIVRIVRRPAHVNLWDLFREHDALVALDADLPDTSALLEAMAFGLVVVVSGERAKAVGGPLENGVTCIVLENRDDLVEALERIRIPEFRQQMGLQARRRVQALREGDRRGTILRGLFLAENSGGEGAGPSSGAVPPSLEEDGAGSAAIERKTTDRDGTA
ncbi:MAG: ATP-binding cassette domain-containing protein [Desulfovibrio sp.]|jgi:ABC-type lipoprotein export system ATPase subunit|nr:ATP-binding cassette domain-containing protein [Desulfovibrio sp.]